MAAGTHWEWRGFGAVSDAFLDRYTGLKVQFGPQEVEDLYIWSPNLQINIKLRKGAEEGLKIKRFVSRDGRLQRWTEDPDDLFAFPLAEPAWHALARELATVNLALSAYPETPIGRGRLLEILAEAGCKTVLVSKHRDGRCWQGPDGTLLVEWATIHKPQPILSIGLESLDTELKTAGPADEQAKAAILAAITALGLEKEPLKEMNYMDAVSLWARGAMITG